MTTLRLRYQIILLTTVRMLLSSAMRLIYPFLPVFARALGVGIADITLGVTVRNFIGIAFPFITPAANWRGSKHGMLVGLGISLSGCLLVAVLPGFPSFFLFIILAYVGLNIFVTSMQTYLSERVPYERRGTALGLTELGWSWSFIIVVPLLGLLMEKFGWQAPFAGLGLAGIILVLLVARLAPPSATVTPAAAAALVRSLGQILRSPAALSVLAVSLAVQAANETVNLVFGVWMEDSFGLKIAGLGLASAVIGFSEMGGELTSTGLVNRLGKERAIRLGLLMNCFCTLILPYLGSSLWGAFAGLFLFSLSFKFAIVSATIMLTEVMPQARAMIMGANVAAFSIGRVIGSALAPLLYSLGFQYNALAGAVMLALAFLALGNKGYNHQS